MNEMLYWQGNNDQFDFRMVLSVFNILLNSYYFAFIMWKKLSAFHILYYIFFSYFMVRNFASVNIYNDGKFEFFLISMFLRFSSMTPETSEEL